MTMNKLFVLSLFVLLPFSLVNAGRLNNFVEGMGKVLKQNNGIKKAVEVVVASGVPIAGGLVLGGSGFATYYYWKKGNQKRKEVAAFIRKIGKKYKKELDAIRREGDEEDKIYYTFLVDRSRQFWDAINTVRKNDDEIDWKYDSTMQRVIGRILAPTDLWGAEYKGLQEAPGLLDKKKQLAAALGELTLYRWRFRAALSIPVALALGGIGLVFK